MGKDFIKTIRLLLLECLTQGYLLGLKDLRSLTSMKEDPLSQRSVVIYHPSVSDKPSTILTLGVLL
jgi:hypothetical protein